MFHSIGDASFEIRDCRPEQPAQALGDSIRKELAARGLITEFYNWGQTGDYQLIYPSSTSLLTYEKYRSEIIGENDLTPLIGYLAEHYPDYKLESVKIENSKNEYFQVIPSKELTFPEQIRLMGELYQATHIMSNFDYDIPESIEGIGVAIGSNDMEYLGDTTLDCEVDIIDVIAVNKHILGIKALDKIAAKNADMNGNGEIEPDDSLAILKTVLSDEE